MQKNIQNIENNNCVVTFPHSQYYRHSQELATEGWQGFRRRLISLHVRFYGVVFVVLMLSFTFYTR